MAMSKREYYESENEDGKDMDMSKEEREWRAFAAKLRLNLEKRADRIPEMTTADLEDFIEACHGAMALAFKASVWDKDLSLYETKVTYGD